VSTLQAVGDDAVLDAVPFADGVSVMVRSARARLIQLQRLLLTLGTRSRCIKPPSHLRTTLYTQTHPNL
jgi:hypothetical protein